MTTAFPEVWRPILHWSVYQVSDRGHVRRRPRGGRATSHLTELIPTATGQLLVHLVSGKRKRTIAVDYLVCEAFHGKTPDKGMTVQHIDGSPWNDWASNLRWEYPIMATKWYSGPVASARRNYFKYGPYATKTELMPHLEYGDIVTAFDDDGQIKAFEFVFGRDLASEVHNPFSLARYWRATVNSLTQVERHIGYDMPIDPNQNPYEAAERYRALANMHPDYLWASYLLDAAFYIERLADCIYKDMPIPAPQVAPKYRRALTIPAKPIQPQAAPPPMARRPLPVIATPVPIITRQARRRRRVPVTGFFTKG